MAAGPCQHECRAADSRPGPHPAGPCKAPDDKEPDNKDSVDRDDCHGAASVLAGRDTRGAVPDCRAWPHPPSTPRPVCLGILLGPHCHCRTRWSPPPVESGSNRQPGRIHPTEASRSCDAQILLPLLPVELLDLRRCSHVRSFRVSPFQWSGWSIEDWYSALTLWCK